MKKLCLIILIAFSLPVTGQERFGYIDYDKVVSALPEYALLQNKLEILKKKLEDSVMIFEERFRRFYTDSIPHNTFVDPLSRITLENYMNKMNSDIDAYQEYAVLTYMNQQEAMESELKTQVVNGMKKFCLEKNVICISDKELIYYCKGCSDLTEELTLYLQKSN